MKLTDIQKSVVTAKRGDLLVSAAAGSGKTAVLTERIVQRILSGQLDVQQVLVVTFTEAAARHMRDRIETKLRSALMQEDNTARRQRLGQQLTLLAGASISTIHAFCLQVIFNFHHLAVDPSGQPLTEPDFTVLEQNESEALLRETLSDWLNELYEAIDRDQFESLCGPHSSVDAFYRLMDGYGNSQGDGPVRELVLSVYHYLRSLPDYQNLMAKHLNTLHEAAHHFSDSLYYQAITDQLRLRLDRAMTVIPDLERQLREPIQFLADQQRNEDVKAQFAGVLSVLRELSQQLPNGLDWDKIRSQTAVMSTLNVPANRKTDSMEKRMFLEQFIDSVAEVVCFLSGQCCTAKFRAHFLFDTQFTFNQSAAEIESEIQTMLPAVELFFQIVNGLDERYTARKRALGVLDFSDFEHIALVILRCDEARQYYANRFLEVYIDEYQDTSSIQETILQAISEKNCLMVGDIKQSIYRFRHARPEIFQGKIDEFAAGSDGQLLELNQNFRSVSGILSAVNDVFAQLMSRGAGEIDYDEHHALVPYRDNLPEYPNPVQLLLVNRQAVTEEQQPQQTEETSQEHLEDLSRDEREARAVVHEIIRLHRDGRAWTDMAVLGRTRSMIQTCREMAEQLGVPVASESGPSTFDLPVFLQLEALLQTLDNEHQDIPLTAVLHGDITGASLSLNELAQIRIYGRENELDYFHNAIFAYSQSGPDADLRSKLSRSLAWLESLRQREQVVPLGELIEQIYTEKDWINRVAAYPEGAYLVRVLRRFQTWTEKYEQKRRKGLFQLTRYLKNLRSLNQADLPIEPAVSTEDAVRMMTVHGSKGLEFPVVFILGISRRLTGPNQQDGLVISENLGIGFDFVDPEQRIRYPSRVKSAMLDEFQASTLAEELRLLYVAMTRAMDQLYLVGSVAIDPEKENSRLYRLINTARRYSDRCLPDHLVRSARTCLEWLILALARNPDVDLSFLGAAPLLSRDSSGNRNLLKDGGQLSGHYQGWQVLCLNDDDITFDKPVAQNQTAPEQTGTEVLSTEQAAEYFSARCLKKRILDPYRFDQSARLPLKLTVSELKERQIFTEDEANRAVDWTQAEKPIRGIDQILAHRAERITDSDSDARPLQHAALGVALHTVFRYLDFVSAREQGTAEEINRQLIKMIEEGMLTGEEQKSIQPFVGTFVRFFATDLAQSIVRAQQSAAGSFNQETPFTLMVPAYDVYPNQSGIDPDDTVLIQGMIDLWFRDEDGITLVDFKSDNIQGSPRDIANILKERYSTQLFWYARALESSIHEPVYRRLIWHIRTGLTVAV